MVSTSVRTAAWCSTQRTPSTMSCQTGRCSSVARPCGGSAMRADQHHAEHDHHGLADERARHARPRTAPRRSAGPTSWLMVMKPTCRRELAIARSSRRTIIGSRVAGGVVGEHLGRAEQEQGDQHDRDRDGVGDDRADDAPARRRPREQVDRDDQGLAVQPVGQDAGPQPEHERREPLHQRRQGDQERVVRLRGDQQRAGRDGEAVADVAHPRRAEQPAEGRAEPRGRDDLDRRPHGRRNLPRGAPAGTPISPTATRAGRRHRSPVRPAASP